MTSHELTAIRILSVIVAYGNDLLWTQRTLCHVLRINGSEIDSAIIWLKKKDLLILHSGEYVITQGGRQYYVDALEKPELQDAKSYYDWRTEVLTGIVEVPGKAGYRTAQSDINMAVLPAGKTIREKDTDPEDEFLRTEAEMSARAQIAKRFGITIARVENLMGQGRIRMCKGDGNTHVGIFDKKGQRFQHVCRECRRQK